MSGVVIGAMAASLCFAAVRASNTSVLAMDRILSAAVQPLGVTVPAAPPGTPLPDVYTAFGKNVSPAVQWDGAPPGVRSYVVVMEDTDTTSGAPTLHWVAYNIPGDAKGLNKDVHTRGAPKAPLGMMQGINYAGGVGYIGPHPADGDPPHHYHFEVFALDRVLNLKPKISLDTLIEAMNERVMAEGEAIATFAAPPPEKPKTPKAASETPPSRPPAG